MRGLQLGGGTDVEDLRAFALEEAAIADQPSIIETLYESFSEVDGLLAAFYAACQHGSRAALECLIRNRHGTDLSNEQYSEAFKGAVMNGQKEVVRYLLDQCPEKCVPGNLDELFVKSACKGYLEIVKYLDLEARKHMSYHTVRGKALSEACARGHWDVAEFLIHAGADVNAVVEMVRSGREDEWPKTALQASLKGILESGRSGLPGIGPLERSRTDRENAVIKQEAVIDLLLANGADVNLVAGWKRTPLHSAVLYCTEAMVRAMIDAGADIHANSSEEGTPLQRAASRESGSMPIVCALLEAGAEIMVEESVIGPSSPVLNTALSFFAVPPSKSHRQVAERFTQSLSVEEVLTSGPGAVIRLILQSKPQLHAKDTRFSHLLQMAAAAGDVDYVQLLVEKGADVNRPGHYYGSALSAAARFGHLSCVQLLIQAGAHVNIVKGRHGTPLQAGIIASHLEIVRTLVGHGADVSLSEPPHGTPMYTAERCGNPDIVKLLVDAGAETSYAD